jgi:hypothetical protein
MNGDLCEQIAPEPVLLMLTEERSACPFVTERIIYRRRGDQIIPALIPDSV